MDLERLLSSDRGTVTATNHPYPPDEQERGRMRKLSRQEIESKLNKLDIKHRKIVESKDKGTLVTNVKKGESHCRYFFILFFLKKFILIILKKTKLIRSFQM